MNNMMSALMNPRAFLEQMMKDSRYAQNPIIKNAIQMAQNGDSSGVETLARNLCNNMGIDPDEAINTLRRMM